MSFDPDLYLQGDAPAPAPVVPPAAAPGGDGDAIAIVGLAGRFPGARDIDEYWRNLREGRESITFFPESEVEMPAWSRFNSKDPNHVRAAGILEDADCFDADLFGYSPREAQFMDPQQRVFLELCWTALEHAGYDPRATGRRVGVYAGTVYSTYLWRMLGEGVLGRPAERMLATIGNLEDNLTTRVAYRLNLRGPAVTVQTACSSSLVAVNLACQSLLAGKCEMALAGGVAIVFPQKTGYLHNPDLIDSRDGHCRAFCRGSTGAIFSNGAGVVVLKRLEAARRDGDTIHAVILGSAVNNDGNDKIGFTAPSVSGQAEVIRAALAQADVDPASISCIEAHGTGTPLGDPIEIAALSEAFGGRRLPRNSCAIGSVKTNIGHLNAAAGVAGLIKTVLALGRQEIPPSLHFEEANPELDLASTPFYVNSRLQPWTHGAQPRRAGVSSFGIGGTNAHVILQEADAYSPGQDASRGSGPHVLACSGRDPAALRARVHTLQAWLETVPSAPALGDVAFTLNAGRTHFSHRVAFVARSPAELAQQLSRFLADGQAEGVFPGTKPARAAAAPVAPAPLPFSGRISAATEDERQQAALALAEAYAAGGVINWPDHYEPGAFRRLPLPTFPFARVRHWLEFPSQTAAPPSAAAAAAPANPGDAPGAEWLQTDDLMFRRQFRVSDPSIGDHRISGQVVVAGVLHLEMARVAAAHAGHSAVRQFRNVYWLKPLVVQGVEAEASVRLESIAGGFRYAIASRTPSGETVHSEGEIEQGSALPPESKEHSWLDAFQAGAGPGSDGATLYDDFARRGVTYGRFYRGIRRYWRREQEILALVEVAEASGDQRSAEALHPGLLDAALQCTAGLYSAEQSQSGAVFLPYSAAEIQLRLPLPARVFVHARMHAGETPAGLGRFDLDVMDAGGRVCLRIVDLCAKTSAAPTPAAPHAIPAPATVTARPPAPAVPDCASVSIFETRLRRHFAATLNVAEAEIDPDQAFSDYGVDSVLAVGIVKSINDEFDLGLRVTDLFSYSSIRQLAAHVLAEHATVAAPTEETAAPREVRPDDFAIIGMAGRFPGADNLEQFWQNLTHGVDSVGEIAAGRWPAPPDAPANSRPRGGFLPAVDEFDPLFFAISPLEAEVMDPQQRLFLEEAWTALEDAGYPEPRLDNLRCGVFVGVSPSDYGDRLMAQPDSLHPKAFTGNATSILAARIAYFLNLKGPCVALDTACSSSLVAVHLACQSILAGDSDIALAGGVHVMATPRIHQLSNRAGMLSPGGACRTFDQGADGMVLGEGAGVVVLKRLTDALRDGDPIHAVIKGSGVNQDGRTNGMTAPSSVSQTALEAAVHDKAGVNPETISYVEAHGTGTALGDPIELRALSDAFRRHTSRTGFCAIGSVKTNIGHLMTAAGIASLLKTVLCLKYRCIPASLHFETPNEHFDFEASPFYVSRTTRPWESSPHQPLRAGVSSFGFSGTNAHLVLEHAPAPEPATDRGGWHLIPVAAKSAEALRTRIVALREWLEAQPPELNLGDLTYTLAVRRNHFEHRAAWVVQDRAALLEALNAASAAALNAYDSAAPAAPEAPHDEAARLLEALRSHPSAGEAQRSALASLARCYREGATIAWEQLFTGAKPVCLQLPAHPFSRASYWLPLPGVAPVEVKTASKISGADSVQSAPVETLVETRTFLPTDWLVRDHQVANRTLVPGTGLLELAVVTGTRIRPGARVRRISDVAWPSPLAVPADAGVEARLELTPEGDDLACRIHTGADSGPTLHFQCRLELGAAPAPVPAVAAELAAVRARAPDRATPDSIYREFSARGLDYGPTLRGVTTVWSAAREAWVRIVAPRPEEISGAVLHPALLDSALQATAFAGRTDASVPGRAWLPFAVGEIQLFRPLEPELFVRARLETDSPAGGFRTYQVDLYTPAGEPLASLRQFSVRAAPAVPSPVVAAPDFCYIPVWRSEDDAPGAAPTAAADSSAPVLIFRTAHDGDLAAALGSAHPGRPIVNVYLGRHFEQLGAHTFALNPAAAGDWARIAGACHATDTIYFLGGLAPIGDPASLDSLRTCQETGVLALFRLAQAFQLHDRAAGRLRLVVVTASLHRTGTEETAIEPWHAALPALAKVISRECPASAIVVVDVARQDLAAASLSALATRLSRETAAARDHDVAYRGDCRLVRRFEAVTLPAVSREHPPFRTQGTYLILGGASGIGLELSRRLAERHQARMILVGRRPLNPEIEAALQDLQRRGGDGLYLQADGTDLAAMQRAVERGRDRFGPIHGAIHSALVLQDGALWKTTEAGFHAALEPKVMGCWILAHVTAREPLDFLAFFSSAAGVFGNAGQGNYAAGCAFKDAFAHYLMSGPSSPAVRVCDWGFWGEAGAVATEAYRKQLAKSGMLPIGTAEGLDTFERVLAGPHVQVMPLKLTAAARRELRLSDSAATDGFTQLTAALRHRAAECAPGPMVHDELTAIERYGRSRLWSALQRMMPAGRPPVGGLREWRDQLGVAPTCARQFEALLHCLVRSGQLEQAGGGISPSARAAGPGPDLRLAPGSGLTPYLTLLDACLDRLPEILTGQVPATEVLFPGNSAALVERVYAGNPPADFFNALLADATAAQVRARLLAGAKRLRILEIGAGTGGASVAVLRELHPWADQLDYCFTDVSPAFVNAARAKFVAHSFVSYRTLDIERHPAEQGVAPGTFDLVIASNVLHASERLSPVIDRVHALLKPHGVLLLNELTQAHDFLLLTFGLTEGWWKFSDSNLRDQGGPLLDFRGWRQLLESSGFPAVAGFGGAPWGDNVIMAVRDETASRLPAPVATPVVPPAVPPAAIAGDDPDFTARVAALVWSYFVQGLKLNGRDAAQPPLRATFDRYGVDSLVTTDLIVRLEKQFGKLPKTLLFEHTSLHGLTGYFMAHHRATLGKLLGQPPARTADSGAAVAESPHASELANSNRHDSLSRPTALASEDIAIIGVSGRYPRAANLAEFWENLRTGRDCTGPIPAERWDVARFHGAQATDEHRRSYSDRGGFIADVDKFDPLFFNISPREAEMMDPQERLFLECAWSAMEDAGYTRERLSYPSKHDATRQRVGVFAGVMYGSYQLYGAEEWARGRFVNTGSGYWSVANRVSYTLDLEGPSFAVDSACSSSLTALHLACESIRRGECDAAFAGGVNLILHPSRYLQLCQVQMLSPDGVCRPFGEGANGFVDGEGVGTLLLKPLAAAERDGDHIYAVIKGSAVNSGGRTNGFTVPSPGAQSNLVRAALARAGVRAETVSYIEAHGTGTALGDPIEITGLTKSFRDDTHANQFCALGSVKGNIGHLEAAAGIAGVTKALLMLQHRQLVPSLHAETPNALIAFEETPFRLQRTLEPWRPAGPSNLPLRAGVSSFGAGGANAHLVLEEYRPAPRAPDETGSPQLVVLSAQNAARLQEAARRLLEFAQTSARDIPFADAVYTLQTGREAFDQRVAFVADGWASLIEHLERFISTDEPGDDCIRGNARTSGSHPAAALQDSELEQTFVRGLFAGRHWRKLAAFWVSGSELDWTALHRGTALRRVPLPTYPFARIRCWIAPSGADAPGTAPTAGRNALHPLLDANESTLKASVFAKRFDRNDDVLREHVVAGQSVLPGVAYLEMVRAAAEWARGEPVAALANVVWIRPLAVADGAAPAFVSLDTASGHLNFEVWSEENGARLVHARGWIPENTEAAAPAAQHDLADLIREGATPVGREQIYRDFATRGLDYGPGFQTVQELWVGHDYSVARLEFTAEWTRASDYRWHPGLMDGALQSILGLAGRNGAGGALLLPFSLRRFRCHRPMPLACYVVARPSTSARNGRSDLQKFDLTILDDTGSVVVEMEECVLREIRAPQEPNATAPARPPGREASTAPAAVQPDQADLHRLLRQLAAREISPEEAQSASCIVPLQEMPQSTRL